MKRHKYAPGFYYILHFTSTFDIVLFHSLSYFVCYFPT